MTGLIARFVATRTTKPFSSVKERDILLDTCIFRYLADKQLRPALQRELRDLRKTNKLAVSQVTHFEIYRRVLTKEEDNFYGRILFAKDLIKLELSYGRVRNAAVLGRQCFPARIKSEGFSNEDPDKHIIGDLLVAGTVVENKSAVLMTANRKHFPEPFWEVVGEKHFLRKKKEGWDGLTIYILKFNYEAEPKKLKEGK